MLRWLDSMAMNTNTRGALKFHSFLWSESKKFCIRQYAWKWKMSMPLNLCFVDRAEGHQDISLLAQLWNVKNLITPVANHAVVVKFAADDTASSPSYTLNRLGVEPSSCRSVGRTQSGTLDTPDQGSEPIFLLPVHFSHESCFPGALVEFHRPRHCWDLATLQQSLSLWRK